MNLPCSNTFQQLRSMAAIHRKSILLYFAVFEMKIKLNHFKKLFREYKHTYLVKDPKQVCARYVVRFKFRDLLSSSLDSNLLSKEFAELDSFEFFDPVTYKPVSIREKMTNNSSSKQLITLDKAYFQAVDEATHQDQIIKAKFDVIDKQIADLDEWAHSINLNYAECHEAILEAQKQAMLQLQDTTKLKLEALLSVEIELRRQKEQLEWMDLYIKKEVDRAESSTIAPEPPKNQKLSGSPLWTKAPQGAVEFLRIWK